MQIKQHTYAFNIYKFHIVPWSYIAALFNLFIVFEHIPSHTKRGVKITLPKPGKTQCNKRKSYRGITLLTSTYKLCETFILNGPHRKLYDSNRSTVSFLIHKFNKAFCDQLPFRLLLCSLVIKGVYESFNVLLKSMNITHDYKKSFSKTYPQIRVHITMHFQIPRIANCVLLSHSLM